MNKWVNAPLIIGIIMVWTGCDKNEDVTPDPQVVVQELSTLVKNNAWVITEFSEDGINETQNYSDMSFEFEGNGTLTSTKNSDVFSGTWSISHDEDDDSNDDNPNSEYEDIDFNILFTSPDVLTELTEDWEIISYSATKIELQHISGGDGSISYLTFEKV